MKALSKLFVLLLATIGLASCGGGGGGSQGAFQPTPSDTIEISTAATSIPTNNFTTITVTVKKHDGSLENDGTQITASVTPTTIGTVSGATGTPAGSSATNALHGGNTSFNFTSSNQVGTATITISVPAGTNGSTTVATKSVPITVTQGTGQDPRLELTATTTTLPANPFTYGEQQTAPFPGNFIGSPYVSEVTVTWRHSNGQLVTGTTPVNVSVSPTSIIAYSTLNTDGQDNFHPLLGSGPVNVTGGVGTIYIHSGPTPGTAVLTVTAVDPDNNQVISSQIEFTVAGGAGNLPTSITFSSVGALYVSNSGGPQSTVATARITDGNNALVPDPDGFDNVQFQITSPNTDARLTGVNAAGQTVTGTTITTVTHNGIAAVTVLAGSVQGPVQIKAIADRGDNNVDNGIQDPVSATATVVVSDGILYSLTLAQPVLDAITANSVTGDTTLTPGELPGDPNATYSLRISATGTDRQGNPPLPGTVVKFGLIDAPQTNGFLSIFGTQGNPQEGGTLFTALDGHFRTAGGGAGPGDTLVVFGKHEHGAPEGNADLESANTVARVNSETSLNTVTPFNRNDTTGVIVDNGPVLPYVIGRAQSGNVSSPATTNALGTATTTINYPVSVLGRSLALWAQGTGIDNITGGARQVTDAVLTVFPGIADATISISPNPIPGNLTLPVEVCIIDAAQNPISGINFTFQFQNLGVGTGKVDGISTTGIVPDATGPDGCVLVDVVTNGINTGGSPSLTFSFGKATATAPISVGAPLVLLANPSTLHGSGGLVTLQLITGNGVPVPGVQIVGTCTGDSSIGIKTGPGVTDAQGKTTAIIVAELDAINGGKSGQCTFSTPTGSPTAVVKLQGSDLCTLFSPPPQGCSNASSTTVTIKFSSTNGKAITASVSSDPNGIGCSISGETSGTCNQDVPSDTYTLTPVPGANNTIVGWSGDCTFDPDDPDHTAQIDVGTSDVECTLLVQGPN